MELVQHRSYSTSGKVEGPKGQALGAGRDLGFILNTKLLEEFKKVSDRL